MPSNINLRLLKSSRIGKPDADFSRHWYLGTLQFPGLGKQHGLMPVYFQAVKILDVSIS